MVNRSPDLNKKYVDQLFIRLKALFGERFGSQFKTENEIHAAKNEWMNAISRVDGVQIKRALDNMRDGKTSYQGWPPTVAQFVLLAKSMPQNQENFTMEKLKPKVSSEIYQRNIAKIRKLLKEVGNV